MDDQFCLISSATISTPHNTIKSVGLKKWGEAQNWLMPPLQSSSRLLIDQWLKREKWSLSSQMELGNFDLMIQCVSLGMGVAFVPRRALSALQRKHEIQRIALPRILTRKMVAIVPRFSRVSEHVEAFTSGILFS